MAGFQAVLVVLLVLMVHGDASALTECEICATTGNCTRAYREQPGQYCGAYEKHGFNEVCCCGLHQICGSPAQDKQCECTSILFQDSMTNTKAPASQPSGVVEIAIEIVSNTIQSFLLIFLIMSSLYIVAKLGAYLTDCTARRADIEYAWHHRRENLNKVCHGMALMFSCFANIGVFIKRSCCKRNKKKSKPQYSILSTVVLDNTDEEVMQNDLMASP